MLVLTLMVFPTTVQSPVPTSRAPVTGTDELNRVDKGGLEAVSPPSIAASVLTFPDPLQVKLTLYHMLLHDNMKS